MARSLHPSQTPSPRPHTYISDSETRFMKRLTRYLTPLVLAAALLAGCSSSQVAKNNNPPVDTVAVRRDTVVHAPTGPATKLWLDPSEWLIDDTSRYVARTIYVRADGPQPAVIAAAKPSCGCILATVLRNRASQSEPGQIRLSIDMQKMPPGGWYELNVITNSTVSPTISMEIRRAAK